MNKPSGNPWFDTFFARKTTTKVANQNLRGKTVIFTGGTDGMGRAAVERFAEMDADICLFGRNPDKTERVVGELKAAGYSGSISAVQCDLSSLSQVRRAAGTVLKQYPYIHYLINCAGINANRRQLSEDGFELNFAVNYLAPFLLTELLLERVKATPAGRIINVTSATQKLAELKFDDLQRENNWSLFASYAQAKLCLIMYGRNLAKRLQDTDTSINSLNPGYIRTSLGRDTTGVARLFYRLFGHLAAPCWVGGERVVAAALDAEYLSARGQYIYEDMLLEPNPQALADDSVARLMSISREMAGLADR